MRKQKEEKSGKDFRPRIVAFVCKWCSNAEEATGETFPGGAATSRSKASNNGNVRVVSVMCSGRVNPSLILKAFELGADGVMVCGCEKGNCHYVFGNEQQGQMFETSRKLVSVLGLEAARLRLEWLSPDTRGGLTRVMNEFTKEVMQAGPSPLRKSGRTT